MIAAATGLPPAAAQSACDTRANLLRMLAGQFGETPIAIGLAGTGNVVELLVSGQGDSWTIIVTRPDGVSCVAAEGTNFDVVPAPPAGNQVKTDG